ncbi:MAG: hypothetical protein WBH01_01125, partial [Dehalococcoidia bacterium]
IVIFWSITRVSFQGIGTPPANTLTVTHVSGLFCYHCIRSVPPLCPPYSKGDIQGENCPLSGDTVGQTLRFAQNDKGEWARIT